MVYKRMAYRRPKRSAYKSKSLAVVSKQVRSIKAHLPLRINYKYIAIYNGAYAGIVNAGPANIFMNQMAEGDDETQRNGDIISWKHLFFKLHVKAQDTLTAPTLVRVVVVRESTTLGANASMAQVFQSATPFTNSCRNFTTRDDRRFHMIYDSGARYICPPTYPVAGVGGLISNTGSPHIVRCEFSKSLNFATDYSRGTLGTVGDVDTNGVTLLVFTDTATANSININYSFVFKGLE